VFNVEIMKIVLKVFIVVSIAIAGLMVELVFLGHYKEDPT